MLVAHFSDPHVIDWSEATAGQFLNKRVTGAANFWLRRAKVHRLEVLEALLDDLRGQGPDHVVVTGDISSLAFKPELGRFGQLLDRYGFDRRRASVIPGNHDAYTRRACLKHHFLSELGRFASSDLHSGTVGFPFVRLLGPVAVIGLDTAVARPWFMANGRLGADQARRLTEVLQASEVARRFPLVLIHHPPFAHSKRLKELHTGLIDRQLVLDALAAGLDGRDGLVLSGHWHKRFRARLEVPGRVELLVASSASHLGGGPDRLGAYTLIEVEDRGPSMASVASIESRGFDPDQGRVVSLHLP